MDGETVSVCFLDAIVEGVTTGTAPHSAIEINQKWVILYSICVFL